MSDAPETIWFTKVRHNIVLNSTRVTLDNTKYRRDDLPATQAQIMADPRVKALVEASFMQVRNCPCCKGSGLAFAAFDLITQSAPVKTNCGWCASGRTALAALTKEPKP